MKKFIMMGLITLFMPMLLEADNHTKFKQRHVIKASTFLTHEPEGSRRPTPPVIDQIDLTPINPDGCWGITYDWKRDGLWICQYDELNPWVYFIDKHSPCTKLDSFQLGSGVPSTRLGIAFAGGNNMYMTGYNNTLYHIDMATGSGSVYRTIPWSNAEGLAWSVFDDAAYPGDWFSNQCAWAIPSQTGAWNTWSSIVQASGLAASFSATIQPQWLFVCNEYTATNIYRYSLVNGVPDTTPDFIWDLPIGMTQTYTADCAYDGQYLYILDQSDPNMVWVLDVAIGPWLETSIEVPFRPSAMVWNATDNKIYVGGSGDSLTIIDGATNLVTHTIPVGDYPHRIIYNTTNDRIYVANLLDSTVSVIKDQGGTGIPEINTSPSELVFNYNLSEGYTKFQTKTVTKKIDPVIGHDLEQKMRSYSEEEFIPIIINMAEHVDLDHLLLNTKNLSKKECRGLAISQLKSVAQTTQVQLLKYLQDMEKKGEVEKIGSLWITNSIGVKATKRAIEQISQMQGIGAICFDPPLELIDNQKNQGYPTLPDRAVVWNVEKINAPGVWQDGYTGKGIVIGHLDSGVNYNHQDIADHMWDGSSLGFPHHGYDFANDDNDPMDDNGHGTHVAGTVAGDGTAGTQTGVAPDALIMAIKTSPGTGYTFMQGVQFAINYGADILTCSVGWEYEFPWSGNWARVLGQGVYAAGVVWSCAAGNGGLNGGVHKSVPYDIIVPACLPAPWYAPNGGNNSVMAVGATDASDVIADFSSWGPTYWDNSVYDDYPYPPGLLKPDVSAPGVNITSLDYASNNGYVSGWDGTSMAAPHLAGTIALLLEKNPYLTPRQIDSIIEVTSIELGPAGRDSLYGAGRIDAYEAALAVTASTSRNKTFYVENESGATGGLSISGITWSASWIKKVEPTLCGIPVGQSWSIKVYVDSAGIPAPGTYWDTLWIYSNDPDENPYPEPICLITTLIGIEEIETTTQLPVANAFCNISPNPFRDKTDIRFSIGHPDRITRSSYGTGSAESTELKIYDVSGRMVKEFILPTAYSPGLALRSGAGLVPTVVCWHGRDSSSKQLSSGVYFVRLTTSGQTYTEKVILLR